MDEQKYNYRLSLRHTLYAVQQIGTAEGDMVTLNYHFVSDLLKEYNDMLNELKELTEETKEFTKETTKTPVTVGIDPKFGKLVYREDIGL